MAHDEEPAARTRAVLAALAPDAVEKRRFGGLDFMVDPHLACGVEGGDLMVRVRALARIGLGGFLLVAGMAHLGSHRQEFQAQVPQWLPIGADAVVVGSGLVEIALGASLILLTRYRVILGWVAAAFFVAVFPGNVAQYVSGTDAFGLDTDRARLIRLFLQPLLVLWALWCTSAWAWWRARRRGDEADG